jgi:glutathione S-transferase
VTLWTDFVRQQARVWRLRLELGEKVSLAPKDMAGAPLASSVISEIMNLEMEHYKSRLTSYENEKAFLKRAIQQADEQIKVLSDQEHLCAKRFTAADVSVGYALLLAQHLCLHERFGASVGRYWQALQQRDGYRRAMQAQLAAATAQGISTLPAPDTR